MCNIETDDLFSAVVTLRPSSGVGIGGFIWRLIIRGKKYGNPVLWGSVKFVLALVFSVTGFCGATETPPPSWADRAEASITGVFSQGRSLATFGGDLLAMIHPSGKEAFLDDVQYEKSAEDNLTVRFYIGWKGGLTGADYKTVVVWAVSKAGHISSGVESDTASTGITKEELDKLDDYFKNTFIAVLGDAQSHKKTGRKGRGKKLKVQNPLAAIGKIRLAIQNFYVDNEAQFPGDIKDLTPKYLAKVPYISVVPPVVTNTVAHPTSVNKDVCSNVTGSGGWLYFNKPEDTENQGTIIIDSAELSPEGRRWCEY